nr:putative reverse transcriptase, RNA-dependent DNA polymerase, Gag-polypeptide of LTR copia-type [Tanacetum cinerariifolium]
MTGTEGDKGGSSVIDFSSPYYIHHLDSPKQPSVNEVVIDRNYNNWAQKMTNFLFAKNKKDFVDETLKKPETSSSEYKSWIRDLVRLKKRFGKESAPRAYELKKKITATREEGSIVSTYYTCLRIGYLLLFSGDPISWKTKKQSVVSRSSAEAEYRAMASTISEIIWVRWLLKDMQVQLTTPTSLFCDNQAARHIANNPIYHERIKHVEMDCIFVRERVETRDIETKPIESKLQLADLLSKGLGTQQLCSLLNKMGIRDLHAPS